MSGTVKIILGVVAAVILLGAGFALYDAVLGETEAASGPISAVPIEVGTPTVGSAAGSEDPYPAETSDPALGSLSAGTASPYPVETAESEGAVEGVTVFAIQPEESEVRFILGEILRGQPKTVIGATDQVAGELAIDFSDLTTAQLGQVLVNARTLVTDSSQRDRAIRNQILSTDAYEFISFTPTGISGLSGSAAVGDTFTFQVTGDLTIRDVTHPVVFDVTASRISEDLIEGTASAVIARADYGLTIPSVQSVAGVDEEVALEIDFVAGVKA
jgi:polyisoprenoid-binding protein YceI